MRFLHPLLATLALAGAAAAPVQARPASPEAELAKAIEGRVPGEPVSCINMHRVRNVQIIDRTALVYDAGSTVYVNRPEGGARNLSDWDVLVTKPFNSQLCDVDIVRLYDRGTWFPTGFVNLGQFVPYKKVSSARR